MARRRAEPAPPSSLSDVDRDVLRWLWEQRRLGELRLWVDSMNVDDHGLGKRLVMLRYALLSGDPETITDRVADLLDP